MNDKELLSEFRYIALMFFAKRLDNYQDLVDFGTNEEYTCKLSKYLDDPYPWGLNMPEKTEL